MQAAGKRGGPTLTYKDVGIFLGHAGIVTTIAHCTLHSEAPIAFRVTSFLVLLAAIYSPTLTIDSDEDRNQRIAQAKARSAKRPSFLMRSPKVDSSIAEWTTSTPIVVASTLSILAGIYGLGLMIH